MRQSIAALAAVLLVAAAAVTVTALDIGPSFPASPACTTVSTDASGMLPSGTTLPVVGLSATDASKQCLKITATTPTYGGIARFDVPLDMTGLAAKVAKYSNPGSQQPNFGLWNIGYMIFNPNKYTYKGYSTSVTFSCSGGCTQRAYGVPIVSAAGVITGVTITQPGLYSTVPTVSFSGGPTTAATAQVSGVAIISATGLVTSVKIQFSSAGWSAASPYFDWDDFSDLYMMTDDQPTTLSPSLPTTNDPQIDYTYAYEMGAAKDQTQCPCSVSLDDGDCQCVPLGGMSDTYQLQSCNARHRIHFEMRNGMTFGLIAFIIARGTGSSFSHYPQLQYNTAGTFTTPLNQVSTVIRLWANTSLTIDPARRWMKEIRVTLTTPLNEQWGCDTSGLAKTYTDCTVQSGYVAKVTSDYTNLPTYNAASGNIYAYFSPATRGIATATVATSGTNYASRPSVSVNRNPTGSFSTLSSITVLDGGSGYSATNPPTVSIVGGSPSVTATGWVATVVGGVITQITSGTSGTGYSTNPAVVITPYTPMTQVYITNCGSGYSATALPAVRTSGTGTGATCTPVVQDGSVTACTVSSATSGSGYSAGATISVDFYATIVSMSFSCGLCSSGSGFNAASPGTISVSVGGSHDFTYQFSYTFSSGTISAVTIVNGGAWYSQATLITFSQSGATNAVAQLTYSTGSGASAVGVATPQVTTQAIAMPVLSPTKNSYTSPFLTATPRDARIRAVMSTELCDGSGYGTVTGLVIDDPGTGYVAGAQLEFSGGSPSVAATGAVAADSGNDATVSAVTVSSTGLITGVTIGSGGSGYASPPTLQFMYRRRVLSITITDPGYGYTAAPFVYLDSPTGYIPFLPSTRHSATASAAIDSTGKVTSVTIADSGSGYITTPGVYFSARNEIISIRVCNAGSGYSFAPQVCIRSTSGNGFGATATAQVNGGVVTGITVTNGGFGYDVYNTVVELLGGGSSIVSYATVDSDPRYITIGTGSNAAATAVIEKGDGAFASVALTSGSVSSVTMVRGGPVIPPESRYNPYFVTSPIDSYIRFEQTYTSEYLPSDIVVRHPSQYLTAPGNAPLNNIAPDTQYITSTGSYSSTGVTLKGWIGAGSAGGFLVGSDGNSITYPSGSDLQPGTKVWSFMNVAPRTTTVDPHYRLVLTAPYDASSTYFPTTDWSSNLIGGSAELGTAFMTPTVKVEFFEYTNINRLWQSGTLRFGETVRFQVVFTSPYWSKVNFTYNATGTGQEDTKLQIRYMLPGSTTWQTGYNPLLGIRSASYGTYLNTLPNTKLQPMQVELSLASCAGPPDSVITFNIMARVYDFKDEGGECNSYIDCRRERGHPTPGARLGLSANADAGHFRDCVVNPTGYTAVCVECLDDCNCNLGQYCHLDHGLCATSAGVTYVCDAATARAWGTCQPKDSQSNIFNQQCVQGASVSNWYSNTEGGDVSGSQIGFCGKNAYYNSSYYDPNQAYPTSRNNSYRLNLWSGVCSDVCLECTEQTTSCGGRRYCADGFWRLASGTNVGVGKVQQAQSDAVQSEVYRNSQINASFLAFAIIITVLLCVGVGMSIKKGSS